MTLKIFSIQVSGIKCTNCAGKIKKALSSSIPEIVKVTVNVIQEKVYVTLDNDLLLIRINTALNEIGFPPLGDAVLVAGGADTERSLHFEFKRITSDSSTSIIERVSALPGVNKCLKNGQNMGVGLQELDTSTSGA
jgi:copper chaperone CopZ